jgi:hypothetical protein
MRLTRGRLRLRITALAVAPGAVLRNAFAQKMGQAPLAAAGRRQLEQWIELQLAVSECE